MKIVVSAPEVARLFATREQSEARSGNGHFFFNGPTIYSYGRHFPIARHVEHGGQKAVLFTTQGFSNSTAVMMGQTRAALKGQTIFEVPNPLNEGHDEAQGSFISRAEGKLYQETKGRTEASRAMYHVEAERIVKEGNAYAAFFVLPWYLQIDGLKVVTVYI